MLSDFRTEVTAARTDAPTPPTTRRTTVVPTTEVTATTTDATTRPTTRRTTVVPTTKSSATRPTKEVTASTFTLTDAPTPPTTRRTTGGPTKEVTASTSTLTDAPTTVTISLIPVVGEKNSTVANLTEPFKTDTAGKSVGSHLKVVKILTVSTYAVLAIIFFALLAVFLYRTYKVKKRLSFYQVRPKKVPRKLVLFRNKKFNYGRDSRGKWKRWVRPTYKPKLYRSNHPQLAGQSVEEVAHQPFVQSTLRIDPEFLHDEYIRLACSHTTFVCEDEVPIRSAPVSFGPPSSPRRYGPRAIGQTYTYFDYLEADGSQSDDEQ